MNRKARRNCLVQPLSEAAHALLQCRQSEKYERESGERRLRGHKRPWPSNFTDAPTKVIGST